MSKKEKPFLTKKQIAKLKEYFNSEQCKLNLEKAKCESEKIRKSMEFTWEKWNEIKDIPFM